MEKVPFIFNTETQMLMAFSSVVQFNSALMSCNGMPCGLMTLTDIHAEAMKMTPGVLVLDPAPYVETLGLKLAPKVVATIVSPAELQGSGDHKSIAAKLDEFLETEESNHNTAQAAHEQGENNED